MAKAFLFQVLYVVLAKDLKFAAQFIVWTLNRLIFALILVSIEVLSLYALAAFVFTVNYLIQASLVMILEISVYNYSITLLVRALYSSIKASDFVRVNFLSFESD